MQTKLMSNAFLLSIKIGRLNNLLLLYTFTYTHPTFSYIYFLRNYVVIFIHVYIH